MAKKRKDPAAKTGATISLILHGFVVLVVFVWAAKTGKLDRAFKAFEVVMAPKEKKPEAPKEKVKELPKPEEKKAEDPKIAQPAPAQPRIAPPPTVGSEAPPSVAPPPVQLADFAFDDGAKPVTTSSNAPVAYYKNVVEFTLRSNWERPTDMADDNFVAEAEVQVDAAGNIVKHALKKGSGDKRWDDSVRKALASTRSINRPPPAGFPSKFDVRFDVLPATEDLIR